MFAWDASEIPQRVLQALGDSRKALAAEDHCGMIPAAVGQPEMIQAMREGLAGDGDVEAVGDGALGFWKAIDEVFPGTRHQRCWVHKTANVLNKVALSVQANMKKDLREV